MYELFETIQDAIFGNDRRADFEYLAQRHDFTFLDRLLYRDLDFEIKGLSIFQNRKRKTIRHLLSRKEEGLYGRILLFDYHSYKDMKRRSTTVLLVESSCFQFPNFVLQPKGMISQVRKLFFTEKPTFHAHPKFDDAYAIKGQRKEMVRDVLCPAVAEILTKQDKLWVEGMGHYLAFYSLNKLADTQALPDFLNMGMDVSYALVNDDSKDYV